MSSQGRALSSGGRTSKNVRSRADPFGWPWKSATALAHAAPTRLPASRPYR